MKNIILFTLFTLSFSHFLDAQVVEKYTDKNNSSTTIIEKVPRSDDQDILNTLSLNDYSVGQEIYIIDHRRLKEKKEKDEDVPVIAEQTVQKKFPSNNTASQIKSETTEITPIGNRVKRKRKRAPRWKSDRRGKRSNYACFKF